MDYTTKKVAEMDKYGQTYIFKLYVFFIHIFEVHTYTNLYFGVHR